MKPFEFFMLISVTIIALVALEQIPLLQTIITLNGYDPVQVWSGIGSIMLVLYSLLYVLTARSR